MVAPIRVNAKGGSEVEIRRAFQILTQIAEDVSRGVGDGPLDLIVFQTSVTPATDGVTTSFTTPHKYRAGTLQLFRNHETLTSGVDFTETSETTFNMILAPDADEVIRVGYIKKAIQ